MLDRVTITGADESVQPGQLAALSAEFPFVEWAMLLSHNRGRPRYPGHVWANAFSRMVRDGAVQGAVHVCGEIIRRLLVGATTVLKDLGYFPRMQLNFRAERSVCYYDEFATALRSLRDSADGPRQFIFQLDEHQQNAHFSRIQTYYSDEDNWLNCVPLCDASGGHGVTPEMWPQAAWYDYREIQDSTKFFHFTNRQEEPLYFGYAGGLGPDNLDAELPKIIEASCDARFWIDMESGVRSVDVSRGDVFDLARVRRVLEICKPFIQEKVDDGTN